MNGMTKICDCRVRVPALGLSITALHETTYNDGNRAVIGDFEYDSGEREQNALSVNIPAEAYNLMDPAEFFLKNWSERSAIAAALLADGILVDSGSSVPTGFVRAPIVTVKTEPQTCLNCGAPFDDDDMQTCDC